MCPHLNLSLQIWGLQNAYPMVGPIQSIEGLRRRNISFWAGRNPFSRWPMNFTWNNAFLSVTGLQSLGLPASLYQCVSQFPIIILFIHTCRSFLFCLWPLMCITIWIKNRAWIQHKIYDMLIQTYLYEMYHVRIEYMLIKTAFASEFFVTSFPKYYIVQWSI